MRALRSQPKIAARAPRSQRGAALLLAIFTCLILTVLAVGLAQVARVEIIASRSSWDRIQASYAAKAGFNLARSVLMYEDDPEFLKSEGDPNAYIDTLQDPWALLGDEPHLEVGGGWCQVKVIDACSMINVNNATAEMLALLIGDPNLAQAVVDYREENGSFTSLGELLLIEGFDKAKLAELTDLLTVKSLECNISASGERRININTVNPSDVAGQIGITLQQAQAIYSYRRIQPEGKLQSIGELLALPLIDKSAMKQIIDKITLTNSEYLPGRVNLNTASREVLLALPGSSPPLVEAIIAKRQEEAGAFKAPGDLLDLTGISQESFIAMAPYICTKSSSFIIEAWAGLSDRPAGCSLQGTVLRQPGPVAPIIYGWKEASRPTFISLEDADQ